MQSRSAHRSRSVKTWGLEQLDKGLWRSRVTRTLALRCSSAALLPPPKKQQHCHAHRDTSIFVGADLWPEPAEQSATDAVNQLCQGMGFSDVVTAQMSQWGAHVYVPNGPFAGRMISSTIFIARKVVFSLDRSHWQE